MALDLTRERGTRVRRIDHQQQVLVNWLLPPDQSALETTIGYEQASIEVIADVALKEPDPYFAQLLPLRHVGGL